MVLDFAVSLSKMHNKSPASFTVFVNFECRTLWANKYACTCMWDIGLHVCVH